MTNKADSKFKIVGAASIAAKVTRDVCLDSWHFEESDGSLGASTWNTEFGSGYPSGNTRRHRAFISSITVLPDPKTQAWLKNSVEPTFGFPRIVRFSWTTAKLLLEKTAHTIKWSDLRSCAVIILLTPNGRTDDGQASLVKAFDKGTGLEKDRCAVSRDLAITSVAMLRSN